MKDEEARQRRKESRTKNGERSRHKAKSKGKHKDSRLGSQEAEDVPLVSQHKQPVEGKGPMAKLQEESAVAIGLQVLLPYLLAGLGMVLAGMVLDYVQVRGKSSSVCVWWCVVYGSEVLPLIPSWLEQVKGLQWFGWIWARIRSLFVPYVHFVLHPQI